jgi:hypothetical protein
MVFSQFRSKLGHICISKTQNILDESKSNGGLATVWTMAMCHIPLLPSKVHENLKSSSNHFPYLWSNDLCQIIHRFLWRSTCGNVFTLTLLRIDCINDIGIISIHHRLNFRQNGKTIPIYFSPSVHYPSNPISQLMTLNIPHSLCFLTKVDTFRSKWFDFFIGEKNPIRESKSPIKIQQNMIVLSPERRRTAASLISPARVILIFRPTMHLMPSVGFYQNMCQIQHFFSCHYLLCWMIHHFPDLRSASTSYPYLTMGRSIHSIAAVVPSILVKEMMAYERLQRR